MRHGGEWAGMTGLLLNNAECSDITRRIVHRRFIADRSMFLAEHSCIAESCSLLDVLLHASQPLSGSVSCCDHAGGGVELCERGSARLDNWRVIHNVRISLT